MDTQSVSENLSDPKEITYDLCIRENTDHSTHILDSQQASGKCEDNEDRKTSNVISQAISKLDDVEHTDGEEATLLPDHNKLYEEANNGNVGGCLKAAIGIPEQKQADGCVENITAIKVAETAKSQQNITEQKAIEASDLFICNVKDRSDSSSFTVVLFGNSSAVHFGDENILLGTEHFPPDQAHIPRKISVSGRALSVINILDLYEGDLNLDQLINENNIQSFIFVLKLRQFTDDDKIGLQWLERKFGESVLPFLMILFTYEREEECDTIIDDLKHNSVLEQLMKKCGYRYCTCSKSMNNQSEIKSLLEKIEHLFTANNQCCYTANIYNELKFKDNVSELRIILLGKNVSDNSNVENFILGTSVYGTEDSVLSVGRQPKRGHVEGRSITILNVPHLFDLTLTDYQLTEHIKVYVSLFNPGPHVIMLVAQPEHFTEADKVRLDRIFSILSDETHKYTMVVTTKNREIGTSVDPVEGKAIQKVISECNERHVDFSGCSQADLIKMMNEMVKKKNYLTCEIYEDADTAVVQKFYKVQPEIEEIERVEEHSETEQEPEEPLELETYVQKEQEEYCSALTNKESKQALHFNIVLFGREESVKAQISNLLCGKNTSYVLSESSLKCVIRKGEICGHPITLVEMPALHNTQLSEQEVMHQTLHCVSLCDPGVHAFFITVSEGRLSNEDKSEIEMFHKIFSSRVKDHTIFIINQQSQKKRLDETLQSVINACGGRYGMYSSEKDAKELLTIVKDLLKENNNSQYTITMYFDAQIETQLQYKRENEILQQQMTELKMSNRNQTQDLLKTSDILRIVLLGKTGVGKSASANTILGTEIFKEDFSDESVTTECQKETVEIRGRQITVIDTPGLFDTNTDNEKIKQETVKCIYMSAPGPHVFLLVLKLGRFTEEDRDAVKVVKKTFGEKSNMYTILLFTEGDRLKGKTIEQYVEKAGENLKTLMSEIGNRYHVFNNNERESNTQLLTLLDKIDDIVAKNGGSYYTNEMFQQVELQKQAELQERILKEKEEQMRSEREEMKVRHKEELESLNRIIQDKNQNQELIETDLKSKTVELQQMKETVAEVKQILTETQQKYKKDVELCKMKENDLENRLKSRTVELQQMKTNVTEEKDKLIYIQQNFKMVGELFKSRETNLEHRLKSITVELQQMKENVDQEKQRLKETQHNYKKDMELCKMKENDLENRLKSRTVELQQMKENVDQEKQKFQETQQNYKKDVDFFKKKETDLIQEVEKLKETVAEEIDRTKAATDELTSLKNSHAMMHQKEQFRKAEEENKRQALEAKLQQIEEVKNNLQDRLQEETKMRKDLQNSYNTIMKEGTYIKWQKNQDGQERMKEIQEFKKCCSETTMLIKGEEIIQRKKETEDLFNRLNLLDWQKKHQTTADYLEITKSSLNYDSPDINVAQIFLKQLLMMNSHERYYIKQETKKLLYNDKETEIDIHPMDVQMAVLHCSDNFLKQLIVTKLAQCQFSLPLFIPNPFTRNIEFPLWTFRKIKKSWKTKNSISEEKMIIQTETQMVACFRFGSVSSSKSQLINRLINEKHDTFFHRHCPGSSKNHLLMDGVVEIAWYFPSGQSTDNFSDCVAFCNLHGDAASNETQHDILMKMSSMNVAFFPDFGQKNHYKGLVKRLFRSPKPLICILTDDDSSITEVGEAKYSIGIKDRNQHEILKELKETIQNCLLKQKNTFKLEDLVKKVKGTGISVDEDIGPCMIGKESALEIINQLMKNGNSLDKETCLPCQGKLWHDWCHKNKDLHRPRGKDTETYIANKQKEMENIRKQQQGCGLSTFMQRFITRLNSQDADEKLYFLKWFEILLNNLTLDYLYTLHQKYDEYWSKSSDVKKSHDKSEQQECKENLENLSDQLKAASFGLEHILREMGQIYESSQCVKPQTQMKQNIANISQFPLIAAKLVQSGFPLELMDGDAAHVPLTWVCAVLDELVILLGDKVRLFVLSVLGIQSSGKSTMLNAMFGLQFAVSAGRCTRGAFMQLVRVSDEMRNELMFDYVLVVDTEGLRALDLAGSSTSHHDNELATFVVGLGNLTLINIFGENPAEMKDILQIVVQAFLRMKNVRINPRCMFIHQNVPDVTAGRKNMEGQRKLQESLNKMTKLAAQEEFCEVEHFSDVIAFDIKKDVRYFSQLWNGSPPMAPLNPYYIKNIEELKKTIFTENTEQRGHTLTMTQFKSRINDLWEALLCENFVFSFKNTLEIAEYRKLEEKYGTWTWTLRNEFLIVQDKFQTSINNKQVHTINLKEIEEEMKETFTKVTQSVDCYFQENIEGGDIIQQWREKFVIKVKDLHEELVKQTVRELNEMIHQKQTCKTLDKEKSQYEAKLFQKSKELALKWRSNANDERQLEEQFDSLWVKWVDELTSNMSKKQINIAEDITQILSESYEQNLVCTRNREKYKQIHIRGNYAKYAKKQWMQTVIEFFCPSETESIRQLIHKVIEQTKDLVKSKPVAKTGYKPAYIQEIVRLVKTTMNEYHSTSSVLNKMFFVDLSLHVCDIAKTEFENLHKKFEESFDPLIYLEKMKPEYYSVFQKSCHGTTSTAVFAGLICSQLGESILQSVYNRTAKDLANQMKSDCPEFNGNRSNLEKHILISLAEEENFEKFMTYVLSPKEHFESFIKDVVREFMRKENTKAAVQIKEVIEHKQTCVITAAETATEEVTKNKGDANMWLDKFSIGLKNELEYNTEHLRGNNCEDISDFQLLTEVVKNDIFLIAENLKGKLNSISDLNMEQFIKKPHEILIDHFCKCCWVQCPFCNAICTNTMENHDGDHSVPFHRNCGINGWHYRRTDNLSLSFCTSAVASDRSFYESDQKFPWKDYRTAGSKFKSWSITPDLSELPYWKWFVCNFQKDLENHYKKTFQGIPEEWRKYTKDDAVKSVNKYI